jgi:hypothetical protein
MRAHQSRQRCIVGNAGGIQLNLLVHGEARPGSGAKLRVLFDDQVSSQYAGCGCLDVRPVLMNDGASHDVRAIMMARHNNRCRSQPGQCHCRTHDRSQEAD